MLLRLLVASLAALPVYSVVLPRKEGDLEVQLRVVDNTVVEAVVTNKADREIAFLTGNSFLDAAPVQKVSVAKGDAPVPFQGVYKSYLRTDVTDEAAVTRLAPGASTSATFDLAETYDLSEGGEFTVVSEGAVPLAADGAIAYKSNTLKIKIDGKRASKVQKAVKHLKKRNDKRTVLQNCSGTRGDATRRALSLARQLSTGAATAASSGSAAKFEEYFGTTASSSRTLVANRYRAVANEAGSTTSGGTDYYCTDPLGYCEPNVLAYTLPSYNILVNCPIYYTAIPELSSQCYGQDRATTSLHELTHAPAVVSPFCDDYAYGYAASTALPSSQALQNADNYALYALDIYLGC